MGDGAQKPFDYERAKALFEQPGKSPAFYNALEERMLAYERENGITDGIGDLGNDPDYQAPAPAQPTQAPAQQPTPPVTQQPPADPEASLWESFLGMGNEALASADAAAGSFMRTDLTDKIGAELGGGLASLVHDLPVDEPGSVVRGASGAQQIQDDMRATEREHPWATAAGDAAQTMGAAALFGPQNAAASLPARVGAGALEGAAVGGAQRAGSAPADISEEQLWSEYLEGAQTGGLVGGAAPVVGSALGAGMQAVNSGRNALADTAKRSGLRNRAAAAGFYGGDLSRAVKEQGRDLPERIGQAIEDAGADQRVSGWLPKSAPMGSSAYADSLGAAKQRVGQQIGAPVDAATARGAQIPQRDVVTAMRGAQADSLAQNVDSGDAMAEHIDGIVNRLTAERAGRGMLEGPGIAQRELPYTPRELWDKRHLWKTEANLKPGQIVTPEATGRAAAYREGRDVLGQQVRGAMNEGERVGYDAANEQFGLLQKANSAAIEREAKELGNAPMGLNSPGAAAAGAMLMGGPGAAAGVGLAEGVRRGFGRDIWADAMGGVAKGLRVGETAVATAPQRMASAVEGASLAGNATGLTDDMFDAAPAMAEQLPATPQSQREAGEHPAAARVRSALNQGDPSKYLGAYADELEQALNEGPQKFGSTLLRLQRDPTFMREVYPVITAGTQGAR